MDKHRILRIINDFADENVSTSGLSPGPYGLTIAQGKLGNRIYVLTSNLNGKNLKKLRFKYNLCDGNVTVFNLPRAIWKFGPFLSSSLFVLPFYFYFRLLKKIDVVHNHQQMGVWFLLYKWIFGFIDKIPVVHTNHATLKPRAQKAIQGGERFDFMTKYFEYPIHMFSDFLSARVANTIIAVGEGTKNEILQYYKPKCPVVVLENAVDTAIFKKKGESFTFDFDKSSVVIGLVGRLSKRKNPDLLVKALAKLPSRYKLVSVGNLNKEMKNVIEKLVVKYDLNSRCKHLPPITNWDLPKYYRAFDLFVLPSNHEGTPKVVIEALSCGCKTIASGFKLNRFVSNLYYLKSPVDANRIKKEIERVFGLKNNYLSTKKVIDTYYSWNYVAAKLTQIYSQL